MSQLVTDASRRRGHGPFRGGRSRGTRLAKDGGVTRINTSHSVNYGGGAQYMLTGKDGIRVDYTRRDFQEKNAPKDDDTWTVSYVRKF